jgi:hypothetical protein
MRSRMVRPAILALLVLLLVAGSAPILAGAAGQPATERVSTGFTDVVNYGTAWVPELRGKFALWRPYGWGTEARVKAAGVGTQWVHIPLPLLSYNEGSALYVSYVEFCAKSSNGAQTRPVKLDIWADTNDRFVSQVVTWAPNNSRQCVGATLSPAVWKASLGVSVQLNFANTTDTITLYKAWAHLVP